MKKKICRKSKDASQRYTYLGSSRNTILTRRRLALSSRSQSSSTKRPSLMDRPSTSWDGMAQREKNGWTNPYSPSLSRVQKQPHHVIPGIEHNYDENRKVVFYKKKKSLGHACKIYIFFAVCPKRYLLKIKIVVNQEGQRQENSAALCWNSYQCLPLWHHLHDQQAFWFRRDQSGGWLHRRLDRCSSKRCS